MTPPTHCPHCDFKFTAFAFNADELPEIAPGICEHCSGVFLLVDGVPRKPTLEELAAIKQSPAWRDVILPVADLIRASKAPPVDRSQTMLTDGSPVTPEHREIQRTGMQKGYVVLTDEERAKGWVRPYRDVYTHRTCGSDTTMGRRIAETYARDPKFYDGTYCCHCRAHYPLSEFVWWGTDEVVGS
jgi:hypothetical protein